MAEVPPACPVPRWQLLKQQLDNVDTAAFDALRTEDKYKLLDVRTADEFAAFHLPEAVNLDYLGATFLEDLENLDPDGHYLVYCRSGRRSVRACTLMKNAGFTHLKHLDGGLNAYENQ